MQVSSSEFSFMPEGADGTTNYPQHHRLMNKTQYGKVVDVIIPPSTSEPPHTHGLKSVMFIDQPTAISVHRVSQQKLQKLIYSSDSTPIALRRPEVEIMEPEPLHFVTNRDEKTPYRAIRIEIKPKTLASPDMQENMTVCGKVIKEDSLVKIWDIAIPPRKSLPLETNSRPGFLISDVISVVNVLKQCKDKQMEMVDPYGKPENEAAERPKVWPLNKRIQYHMLNPSNEAQYLYCLEIKA